MYFAFANARAKRAGCVLRSEAVALEVFPVASAAFSATRLAWRRKLRWHYLEGWDVNCDLFRGSESFAKCGSWPTKLSIDRTTSSRTPPNQHMKTCLRISANERSLMTASRRWHLVSAGLHTYVVTRHRCCSRAQEVAPQRRAVRRYSNTDRKSTV